MSIIASKYKPLFTANPIQENGVVALAQGAKGFERKVFLRLLGVDEVTPEQIERAKLAAELSHQNIVQALDLVMHEDTWFIATEHIDGFRLDQLLDKIRQRKFTISTGSSVYIISQALLALSYAHNVVLKTGEKGINHKQLRPDVILINNNGDIKLAGFEKIQGDISPESITRLSDDHRDNLMQVGRILLTLLNQCNPDEEKNSVLKKIAKQAMDYSSGFHSAQAMRNAMLKEHPIRATASAQLRAQLQTLLLKETRPIKKRTKGIPESTDTLVFQNITAQAIDDLSKSGQTTLNQPRPVQLRSKENTGKSSPISRSISNVSPNNQIWIVVLMTVVLLSLIGGFFLGQRVKKTEEKTKITLPVNYTIKIDGKKIDPAGEAFWLDTNKTHALQLTKGEKPIQEIEFMVGDNESHIIIVTVPEEQENGK